MDPKGPNKAHGLTYAQAGVDIDAGKVARLQQGEGHTREPGQRPAGRAPA